MIDDCHVMTVHLYIESTAFMMMMTMKCGRRVRASAALVRRVTAETAPTAASSAPAPSTTADAIRPPSATTIPVTRIFFKKPNETVVKTAISQPIIAFKTIWKKSPLNLVTVQEHVLLVPNLGPEHYSSLRNEKFVKESVSCLSVDSVATCSTKTSYQFII